MPDYADLIQEKNFLDVSQRSTEIGGARIMSLSQADAIITFSIQGLTGVYNEYIRIKKLVGVNTSSYTVDELTSVILTSDLEVACTCPAFLYWGFQYISAIESYGLWIATISPDVRNPNLRGNVCKHLYNILSNWPRFSAEIAELFPHSVISPTIISSPIRRAKSNNSTINKSMKKKSILFQAKAKLAKMLNLELASVETSDGKTLYVDGDIVAGAAIYELTDAGEYVPALDGTYTADGMTIVVSAGTVSSVEAEEGFENTGDIDPADESSGDVVSPQDHNDLVEVVNEILEVVKEQEEEISSLQEEVVKLDTELKRATASSKGKPAGKDTFNKRTKAIDFADQKMKKLIENFK